MDKSFPSITQFGKHKISIPTSTKEKNENRVVFQLERQESGQACLIIVKEETENVCRSQRNKLTSTYKRGRQIPDSVRQLQTGSCEKKPAQFIHHLGDQAMNRSS